MPSTPTVILKPRRARPFFARHPWVFDSSIERVDGDASAGEEVNVVSHEGMFIARGLYNPRSTIRVRLYRWDQGSLDEAFWSGLIAAAARLRHQILGLGGDRSAYRLISSEGDGLSGLTVDRYDRWLSVQCTSLALFERRELILRLLRDAAGAEGTLLRTERGIAQKEGLPAGQEITVGSIPVDAVPILENGLTYHVDLRAGQKTGFYLDQRLNRHAVAGYCRGREVLDLFCFTGGFSLSAALGGAAVALGVDSSAPRSNAPGSTPPSTARQALNSRKAMSSRFSRPFVARASASAWSSATRPSLRGRRVTSNGRSRPI